MTINHDSQAGGSLLRPVEIDTLIEELQRARAEGATQVVLQVNVSGARVAQIARCANERNGFGFQAAAEFAMHDPNMRGVYVLAGTSS